MNVTSTPWERERIYVEEECRQAERERALRDIVRLMRCYEISPGDLEPLLQDARTPRRQCDLFFRLAASRSIGACAPLVDRDLT